MPLNCGDFSLWSTRRVNLNSIVGTIAPNYNGGLTSLILHDFIILMTLLIGTSGYNEIQMILRIGTLGYNIRYTSEYIPNLQIHQQSACPKNCCANELCQENTFLVKRECLGICNFEMYSLVYLIFYPDVPTERIICISIYQGMLLSRESPI